MGRNGANSFGRRAEGHKRHLLRWIRKPVLVLGQVIIIKLTSPVDHGFILLTEPVVLPVHLLVHFIILKDTRGVFRIMCQLRVAEEVAPILVFVADPLELIRCVAVNVRIVALS